MKKWFNAKQIIAIIVLIAVVILIEYAIVRKAVSDALQEIYVQETLEIR